MTPYLTPRIPASQVVFLVFLGITFSTALPLALPLTAFATGLLAFIERLYLLRVYKKPPRFSAELIESAVMLLRLSVLAKVLSTICAPFPPCAPFPLIVRLPVT